MINIKTIDGVPRELMERMLDSALAYEHVQGDDLDELRALLDAPAVQWLAMEVNGKPWVIKEGPNADKWRAMGYELFPVEPAAQPQGEPVEVERLKELVRKLENDNQSLKGQLRKRHRQHQARKGHIKVLQKELSK